MKKSITFLIILCCFIFTCQMENKTNDLETYKSEILKTEQAFAEMVKKEGLKKAFLTYADENAVLNRNNSLVKGKLEIEKYFDNQTLQDVKLEWKPDFIDVSESGDLAYTYGNYNFEAKDTSGQIIQSNGIFHTVWKKQADGKWLFVWD